MHIDNAKTPLTDVAKAIRDKLLEGRAEVAPFAAATGKSERTIHSYIRAGMPTDWLGRKPLAIVEPAIEWLRNRKKRGPHVRDRGRPAAVTRYRSKTPATVKEKTQPTPA